MALSPVHRGIAGRIAGGWSPAAGHRRLRPATLTGRPAGLAPCGILTSLTTRTVRAGIPPRGGTRTGVMTRTKPARGRGTERAVVTALRAGCRRTTEPLV